ncbi:hypothetical protein [Salinibaculum salinum]|uniref:hypothetical protein n=1 Tax=Salinibaculum salinum TaxID=3131996 RepID=UPI0030EB5629
MNSTLGRWLLVTLALVGLALAVPAVAAHGDGPTQANETTQTNTTMTAETPAVNTTADWPTWMEDHMATHMGPAATEWMESHMGVNRDDSAQAAAGHHWNDDTRDSHWNDDTRGSHWNDDTHVRGTHGQGHGC